MRSGQSGNSTFPEFLEASWYAGIVRYEVDFTRSHSLLLGVNGEEYVESYPEVDPI